MTTTHAPRPAAPSPAPPQAHDLDERAYRELVHEAKDDTLRVAEQLIGYAGGSEDGEPVRIATGGLLGWSVEHHAARPLGDGQPGDPHLHLHVVIANMALCEDGTWRSIANSGRDLYRHAAVLDGLQGPRPPAGARAVRRAARTGGDDPRRSRAYPSSCPTPSAGARPW